MPSSRGSSQPRDWSQVSRIGRWVLYQLNSQGSPSVPIFSSESDSRSVVSDSLWPHGLYSQSTEVGSLFLPQGIFPTKGPTRVSWTAGGFFTNWALREVRKYFKVIIECLLFFFFFTVQCFTQHEINHFKVNNSVAFSAFARPYTHPLYLLLSCSERKPGHMENLLLRLPGPQHQPSEFYFSGFIYLNILYK